jgi:putative flippase GtrA
VTAEVFQLLRFGAVGVSNTVVSFSTFALLVALGVPSPVAAAAAFAAGAANGYRLNRAWTFRVAPGGPGTLARYVAVQALGAGLSAGGVALLRADAGVASLLAEAIVLPCVTLVTYSLSRRLVFAGPRLA